MALEMLLVLGRERMAFEQIGDNVCVKKTVGHESPRFSGLA